MAVIDTTLDSITIVQTMQYRGAPEEWSNTYFFDGDLPSSPASWKTLADEVIADQKTVIDTNAEHHPGHRPSGRRVGRRLGLRLRGSERGSGRDLHADGGHSAGR